MSKIKNIKTNNFKAVLGFPGGKVHPIAEKAFAEYFPYQSNNIGVHTFEEEGKMNRLTPSKEMERNSIKFWSNLLGGSSLDGYISSGGTEGNIMGIWIARNKMRKNNSNGKTAIIKSGLSHYSLDKAADLLSIDKVYEAGLNEEWSIDAEKVRSGIQELSKEGFNKFIVVATIGNTLTGTVDNVFEICNELKRVREENSELQTYLHVDGAIGGYILPFLEHTNSQYFSNIEVESLSLDSHKMGLTPYPGGIFLSRKGLLSVIEKPIKILDSMDRTLMGSRSGASAVSIWHMLDGWGIEGYRKNTKYCLEIKEYFKEKLLKLLPLSEIKTDRDIYTMGVCFKELLEQRLPLEIEKSFCLVGMNCKELSNEDISTMYSFVFMPHIKKEDIDLFFSDCKLPH